MRDLGLGLLIFVVLTFGLVMGQAVIAIVAGGSIALIAYLTGSKSLRT